MLLLLLFLVRLIIAVTGGDLCTGDRGHILPLQTALLADNGSLQLEQDSPSVSLCSSLAYPPTSPSILDQSLPATSALCLCYMSFL